VNSIGHDPLIHIEGGGLIPIENLSKPYFLYFPRVWNILDQNPKARSQIDPLVVPTSKSSPIDY
jgi:hypothetical protein